MFANIYYNWSRNKITLWEYDKEGQRHEIEDDYVPYCYVPDKNGVFKDIHNKPCRRKEFSDYMAQKEFVKNYETFEGDIAPDSRYLIDRYYNVDLLETLPELNIHILDIEVSHDDGMPQAKRIEDEILAITVYSTATKKFHTFGTKHYSGTKQIEYNHCDDEKELLKKYLKFHRENYPDIITGWFSNNFDIPYILDRMVILFGEGFMKKYSPVRDVELRDSGDYREYFIGGITLLDYIDMYKKFNQNEVESHKLDYIAKIELGKEKLKYEGTLADLWKDDWNKFIDYNVHDVELVKEIHEKLDFIGLTQAQCYFSRVPLNKVDSSIRKFDNYLLTILKDKNIVLPTAKRQDKMEIPGGFVSEIQKGFYKNVVSYDFTSLYPHLMFALNLSPETFVAKIEPENGKKNKLVSDNQIEYTHIDFLTIYDEDNYSLLNRLVKGSKLKEFIKKNNLIISANGLLFKPEEGFIPKAVKAIFAKRKEYKNISKENEKVFEQTKDKKFEVLAKRYDLFQAATKVLANAAYGILANENFRLFNPDFASAITLTGQKLTKYVGHEVDNFFKEKYGTEKSVLIASDTDSIYINIESFVKKHKITPEKLIMGVNLFSEKVFNPLISTVLNKFSNEMLNNPINWFHLKREAITDGAIFIEKKKYALSVIDNEGITFKEPKIKVKGMEIVRSSTPSFCREKIKDVVKQIFKGYDKNQILEMIKQIKNDFVKADISTVAFPRGVKNISDYIENGEPKKGCPIHVRAAINYNKLVEKHKLERDYELIKTGSKMRFLYLTTDAKNTENIIGFIDDIPKQFGIEKYIDYNVQFEKSFMSPLQKISEAMGWGKLDITVADISEFF